MSNKFEILLALIGHWKGKGEGSFPTIDSFHFNEEFKFERREAEQLIHYEQNAILIDGTPSHWESGFFIINEENLLEISSAQDSGRVEVLIEEDFEILENGFRIKLKDKFLQNDERLKNTGRIFELQNNFLNYSMSMSTTKVSNLTHHISSKLERK